MSLAWAAGCAARWGLPCSSRPAFGAGGERGEGEGRRFAVGLLHTVTVLFRLHDGVVLLSVVAPRRCVWSPIVGQHIVGDMLRKPSVHLTITTRFKLSPASQPASPRSPPRPPVSLHALHRITFLRFVECST